MGNFLEHILDQLTPLLEVLPLGLGMVSKFFSMGHKVHSLALPLFQPHLSSPTSTLNPHGHHLHLHHPPHHQGLAVRCVLGTTLSMFHIMCHLHTNSPIRWGLWMRKLRLKGSQQFSALHVAHQQRSQNLSPGSSDVKASSLGFLLPYGTTWNFLNQTWFFQTSIPLHKPPFPQGDF